MVSSAYSRASSGASPKPVLNPPDFEPLWMLSHADASLAKRYCAVSDQGTFCVLRERVPLTGCPASVVAGVSTAEISDNPGAVTELLIAASLRSCCQRIAELNVS